MTNIELSQFHTFKWSDLLVVFFQVDRLSQSLCVGHSSGTCSKTIKYRFGAIQQLGTSGSCNDSMVKHVVGLCHSCMTGSDLITLYSGHVKIGQIYMH